MKDFRRSSCWLALAVTVAACQAPQEPLTAPNVLFIVIDCLRTDHVGTYGYERPTTPNLDALALEATVFEHAYAQSYWTRPSVVSYLTGLYPSEHGLFEVETDEKNWIQFPLPCRLSWTNCLLRQPWSMPRARK